MVADSNGVEHASGHTAEGLRHGGRLERRRARDRAHGRGPPPWWPTRTASSTRPGARPSCRRCARIGGGLPGAGVEYVYQGLLLHVEQIMEYLNHLNQQLDCSRHVVNHCLQHVRNKPWMQPEMQGCCLCTLHKLHLSID